MHEWAEPRCLLKRRLLTPTKETVFLEHESSSSKVDKIGSDIHHLVEIHQMQSPLSPALDLLHRPVIMAAAEEQDLALAYDGELGMACDLRPYQRIGRRCGQPCSSSLYLYGAVV